MKKIVFILALCLAFISVEAQFATSYIAKGNSYIEYPTDVTLTAAVTQYWKVVAPQNYYTAQTAIITLDTGAVAHTTVSLQLSGRASDQTDTWTSIGSPIVWHCTAADTVIIYTNATENLYREFKLLFTGVGVGATSTITNCEFKEYYGTP